jgi:hypothetical protein
MKKKHKYLLASFGILAVLIAIYYFQFFKGQMYRYSFSDICYSVEEYKNYPRITGKWDLGALPKSLTINVGGKVLFVRFAFDKTDVDFTLGHNSAIRLIGTTCNAEGQCVDFDSRVYAFDFGEFDRCYDSCKKYNWPGQCSMAQYMPISYNCYNLCAYDIGTDFNIDSLKPSKSYTITIKEIKKYRYGGDWETSYNYAIDAVYAIIYDPNDRPWERICSFGEKKNYRCDGAYKVWDECSSDGKRWITQKQLCQFGCLNGNCLTSPPTPTIPPKPIWENLINKIIDWLKSLFSFFIYQIYGEQQPLVGSQQTYTINITTTPPDSDYSDGSYQIQYASWALLDSSGKIISKGDWEEVRGTYYKQITITIPPTPQNYVITAIIYQYDMKYNPSTQKWDIVKEDVVAKEAISLNAKVIAPPKPQPPSIMDVINRIIDWLKNLFSWFFK